MTDTERMTQVLKELIYRNPLRNDMDAYTLYLAQWVIGESNFKPAPSDFRLEEIDQEEIERYFSKDEEE
jgi:hypothetical protein